MTITDRTAEIQEPARFIILVPLALGVLYAALLVQSAEINKYAILSRSNNAAKATEEMNAVSWELSTGTSSCSSIFSCVYATSRVLFSAMCYRLL